LIGNPADDPESVERSAGEATDVLLVLLLLPIMLAIALIDGLRSRLSTWHDRGSGKERQVDVPRDCSPREAALRDYARTDHSSRGNRGRSIHR
jgi:hypothetical protein